MSKKLRLGLIGAGKMVKIHAENIVYSVPNAELTAISVVNLTADKEAWIKNLGIPSVVRNPEDIINSSEIDAVLICGITATHADLTIAAAKAGKHIFCEKPVDLSVEKVKLAIAEVKKNVVKLQVGFNRRFSHNFRRICELSKAGKIGQIHMVKIISRDPAPPPLSYIPVSGGIFLDQMVHDFDMARFLAGSEITEVYAAGAVLIDPEIGKLGDVDTALVTIKFSNGAIGIIENSRQAVYGYDQRLEVFGSKGLLRAENDIPNTVKLSTKDGVQGDGPTPIWYERYRAAFVAEIKSFVDVVQNNKPVEVTGEDGLASMYAAIAAGKSLREKRTVTIEEIISEGGK
jgi:myo-inositol 2-dehydrogenase/D-chiro-inositol 1-dehydrogenase